MTRTDYPPVSDYAFLSDCHSVALVSRDASVEWACFHRFDGRSVFARILDRNRGGYFRIAPVGQFTTTRRYLPDTNVLETRFDTATGVVTVTDCLPVREDLTRPGRVERRPPEGLLLRTVRSESGTVDVELEFAPRFEYGMTVPHMELTDEDLAVVTGGPDCLLLQSGLAPLKVDDLGNCTARTTLTEGQVAHVALTYARAGALTIERHSLVDLNGRLAETVAFWTNWAARCTYQGPHRDAVVRSALVLKGLIYDETGALAAAPTTSLPEEIGGERNWDYRYTWLRDSAAMLGSLGALGYLEEAERFGDWLLRTTAGRAEDLQIMYGIGGERLLHEVELDHLEGYRASRPVRVGNGAWDQFQLDTYGELLEATLLILKLRGRQIIAPRGVRFLRDVVDLNIKRWKEPDEGIWEIRGERRNFVFSKLMAWAAVDCGIRLLDMVPAPAQEPGLRERWAQARQEIRTTLETKGVDPKTGAFLQAFDHDELDASSLQVSLRGFLPGNDPRILATIDRTEAELTRNGHVYRYLGADGLSGEEGSFVFCTLWLASALARAGRTEKAEKYLAGVLDCANDLGLLAEEVDPDTGEQLGNFPQGFSHLGVIAAALNLAYAQSGADAPWPPRRSGTDED
ncbi:glycoside hydrolase family 15 protein [Streptomyces sp. NBC_01142]|uniref:glycoside hydrolase family 15 protein n=1 Tax=Streptomyces sp. NBC_01142 TaxID=2975865 RepID=UPI002250E492|nr:glycoside hydrolase family 15 protein [Streptomyces sp. NBC_01142]MCX4821886.1 glycoside hydrolase family 15 protein [Streptomyces sp. NBC_01142]